MKFTIMQQPGCETVLSDILDLSRILVKMGYTVHRTKIKREGQKTSLLALVVQEAEEDEK